MLTRIFEAFKRTPPPKPFTVRQAAELASHEAFVLEAYKDSVGVWTWGCGVTNASGHTVFPRYKDKPQPLTHCIGVYLWLLEHKYLPAVRKAFKGRELAEHELAAALSFHYNTGAILRAEWVKHYLAGDTARARTSFLHWCKPTSIIERRTKERNLFFDGKWAGDGSALVYQVAKPSYSPVRPKRIDVTAAIAEAMA